jgi:hypothetical protein
MRIERKELAPGRRDAACVACGGGREEEDRERFFLESGDQICLECVAGGAEYIAAKFLERAEESRRIAARYEAAVKEGIWVPEPYQREAAGKIARL